MTEPKAASSRARRVVALCACYGLASGAVLANAASALRADPSRQVPTGGLWAVAGLAVVLGAVVALVLSPLQRGAALLGTSLLAALLWVPFTFVAWPMALPAFEAGAGWGAAFAVLPLGVSWGVLALGLTFVVAVPAVRRERTRPPGVTFLLARTVAVSLLAAVALFAPAMVLRDAAPPSSKAPLPHDGADRLEVGVNVVGADLASAARR